jgi:hypothetical protein
MHQHFTRDQRQIYIYGLEYSATVPTDLFRTVKWAKSIQQSVLILQSIHACRHPAVPRVIQEFEDPPFYMQEIGRFVFWSGRLAPMW